MAATRISNRSLLRQIKGDYPEIRIEPGVRFTWHAADGWVEYDKDALNAPYFCAQLLHELSHALLGHTSYEHELELLRIELAAWEYAKTLAHPYGVCIADDFIESCLDTYRDRLHSASTCPVCTTHGIAHGSTYTCPNCEQQWSTNKNPA